MICFFDTHVLVYAVDTSDLARQECAIARFEQACANDTVVISTQVLQEFFNATTRKMRPPLSPREAMAQMERLCAFTVLDTTAKSVLMATALMQQHRLQWWDALILEAALRANADVLVSRDGQHGQRFGKLTVENPFL
jgi:predicted nucleic acid-binding protein